MGVAASAYAGVWGFGRSMRIEYPKLRACINDALCGSDPSVAGEVLSAAEVETAWMNGECHAARLRQRRIIDAEKNGLTEDLDEALETRSALEIINDYLLAGMRTVGELFGSGQMQLPFVLASAETMKTCAALHCNSIPHG